MLDAGLGAVGGVGVAADLDLEESKVRPLLPPSTVIAVLVAA
ncbi:hypothetical protein [Streptomyces sp. NPDC048282]